MGKSDAVPASGLDMKSPPHRTGIAFPLPASLSLDPEMSGLRYLLGSVIPLEVGSVSPLLMQEPSLEGLLSPYLLPLLSKTEIRLLIPRDYPLLHFSCSQIPG